jgi:hypothetical protein
MLLEDDKMSVRLASIKAISVFASRCPAIRQQCLRYLIDMLNDEIDDVRIEALHGIERFNKVLSLTEYDIESVLFNLNEDNLLLRSHIYALFGNTTILDEKMLFNLIERLVTNLWKYQNSKED